MSKPNKLKVLPECPDCGAVARDDVSYRCASTPWSQSWTCLGDKSRRLQTRIEELEAVVDKYRKKERQILKDLDLLEKTL